MSFSKGQTVVYIPTDLTSINQGARKLVGKTTTVVGLSPSGKYVEIVNKHAPDGGMLTRPANLKLIKEDNV